MKHSMHLFATLEKSKDFWFLLSTSFVFFLLRLPSLFEPYWYGDEGIYETIGMAMRHGSFLYKDTWDNKPPLLYMLYALGNGDQFFIRFISLIFGICSVIAFFLLLKMVKKVDQTHTAFQRRYTYLATILFAVLFAIPLFEGNIANAENFMLLFSLCGAISLLTFTHTKNPKMLWYAGLLLSLETLFKIVGIFDFLAFSMFLLIIQYKTPKNLLATIQSVLPFGIAFSIPLILTTGYFFIFGAGNTFLQAAFMQNVGYVGYGNYFIIPQGLLYLKVFLLIIFIGVLFQKRNLLSKKVLFSYLWLSFSLFSSFFSQRPYTHYVLLLLPSLCFFTVIVLESCKNAPVRNKKALLSLPYVSVFVLPFVLFLIWHNFDIYRKTIPYYQNFSAFMRNTKSLYAYQSFFDSDVPRDYAISQFLRKHTKTHATAFLWGNTAQVYKMSETLPPGRYTVAYHITSSPQGIRETAKALKEKTPRFIVMMSDETFPFDLSHYRYVYSIENYPIYEYIF